MSDNPTDDRVAWLRALPLAELHDLVQDSLEDSGLPMLQVYESALLDNHDALKRPMVPDDCTDVLFLEDGRPIHLLMGGIAYDVQPSPAPRAVRAGWRFIGLPTAIGRQRKEATDHEERCNRGVCFCPSA